MIRSLVLKICTEKKFGEGIIRKLGQNQRCCSLMALSPSLPSPRVHIYMYIAKPLADLTGFSQPLLFSMYHPYLWTICCYVPINLLSSPFSNVHHPSLKIPTLCSLWKLLTLENLSTNLVHELDTEGVTVEGVDVRGPPSSLTPAPSS